jgi:hypothetical protein
MVGIGLRLVYRKHFWNSAYRKHKVTCEVLQSYIYYFSDTL